MLRRDDDEESTALESEDTTVVDSGDDGGGSALASAVPESLTITVDLPTPVHSVPEDEVAVSINEVAINPGGVETSTNAGTTTITIVADNVVTVPEQPVEVPVVIPQLPEPDDVYTRRGRKTGKVSDTPETAAALTAERLIEPARNKRHKPEGFAQRFLFELTFHFVNVGDSRRARARKNVEARIDKSFDGGARFIAVLSRKGGVGKTTMTSLLGMAMADVREDRVIAIDANPDRGTLAERVNKQTRATARDLVTKAASIQAFSEFQHYVSRHDTRLDVIASDTDPLISEAFDENDYNVVADLAQRFYSIVLTDCGTGIVHSVMRATLQRADAVVIVSGGSVDEARLASETLTWLESNGYVGLVRNAVVALNTATQGTNLVKLEEIEAHFQSRVRDIVRIPYDPQLATGSVINYKELRPITKSAARELAAVVLDGLPTRQAN